MAAVAKQGQAKAVTFFWVSRGVAGVQTLGPFPLPFPGCWEDVGMQGDAGSCAGGEQLVRNPQVQHRSGFTCGPGCEMFYTN